MRIRLAHLARLTCLASLFLAACAAGGGAGPSNETAGRILTAVATRATATQPATETRTVASSTTASPTAPASPTPAEPTATPLPPMVFARCIVRAESPMRREPVEAAQVTAPLQSSDIVTAYGRTADGQWIVVWNREITFGWIPSGILGCSAPLEDLRPTEPDVLLTPQPTVARPEPMAGAATATPVSVAAMTTGTPVPAATSAPGPTATALPATGTAVPVETPPAATETSTPAPTATELPAIATATPVVATQEATATAAITLTLEPATPTVTVAATEPLTCVVAINRALNLRAGPDRTTRLLGQLRPGTKFSATGRNTDATWLYGATARGDFGWVIASAVRCDGDTGGLPVVNGG